LATVGRDGESLTKKQHGIAAVAYDNKLPWHSFKYITDDANESSGSDWADRVSHGEDLFIEILKQFK
jgi:adenosylhomocysteine nucleosidase